MLSFHVVVVVILVVVLVIFVLVIFVVVLIGCRRLHGFLSFPDGGILI